jgi:hypothetical protein
VTQMPLAWAAVSYLRQGVAWCQIFGEMEESYLLLCLSYLPEEKRTSISVRSTFLAIWAYVATQGLPLPPGTYPAEYLRIGEYNQHV